MLRMHERAFLLGAVFAAAISVTACGADPRSAADDLAVMTMGPMPMTTTETTTTTIETTTTTELTTPETTTVTTTLLTTTTETTALTIGSLPVMSTSATTPDQIPDANGLTAEDYAFLSDTVFVGDSICSGLRVYGILSDDHVVAQGCVAARNIFEYTFNVRGNDVGVAYGLSILKPRYVIFSMGMNDVNMTSPEVWCENYDNVMRTIRSVLPDSVFYVASITPIAAESEFCSNDRIDLFNNTMRAHLAGSTNGFLDVSTGLKTWGSLNPEYNGGDGVHLAPAAYYAYLNQICDQLVDTKVVGGYANGIAYGWAKT